MSMSDTSTGAYQFAAGQLRSLIERIERLDEEIHGLNQDKKEVYAEAKAHGFDPKIMRKVVGLRKKDRDEREEEETLVALYMSALGMLPADPSRVQVQAHAREADPPHDPETGEILDNQATTAETEPQETGAPLGDEADAPADNPGGADAVATETVTSDSTQTIDPTRSDDLSAPLQADGEAEEKSPPASDGREIAGSYSDTAASPADAGTEPASDHGVDRDDQDSVPADNWPADIEEGWEINPVTGEREAVMPAHLMREA